jgi:hypothetical protein
MEQAAQRRRNQERDTRRNDRPDVRDKKLDGPNRPAE